MSLSDFVNSLPPERKERALAEFEAMPEPKGDLEDLFDEAAYERGIALDPRGQRISRVLLRLSGDATADASLDDISAGEIFGAFGREVRAAAGDSEMDARLRLVGFSAGSVVLHFEPTHPEIEQGADGALPVHSVADHAIETVLDLHRAIELQLAPAEIQSRFKQPGLLKAARRFLDVLDKDGLDAATRWYGPGGSVSRSALTGVGRRYALDVLFAKDEEREPELISGMVQALDMEGIVTIKSGKRKPKVKVPAARITDGSFQIGKYTQIRATKTFLHDKVGLTGGESYEFVAFAFSGDDTPLIDVGD